MKTYLVGGAIRDSLLQLPVTERDWLVVGATVEQMLAQGFEQADPEFPVFRHPETREEYALARHEIKTGKGYRGFAIDASDTITLQQDLARRDLTINAIAQDEDGTLIDPFNGQDDLRNGYLRHITPAFCEDPVRVLRIARFTAKLGHLDFRIAPVTQRLLSQMVYDGAANELHKERIVQEMRKALGYQQPWQFFSVLNNCHGLAVIWPKLAQSLQSINLLDALQCACHLSEDTAVRFVALALQVPPPLTWLQALPARYRDLLGTVMQAWQQLPHLMQADAQQAYDFLQQYRAWHNDDRYQHLFWILQSQGQQISILQKLHKAQQAAAKVKADQLIEQGLTGARLGQALAKQRQAAITGVWT